MEVVTLKILKTTKSLVNVQYVVLSAYRQRMTKEVKVALNNRTNKQTTTTYHYEKYYIFFLIAQDKSIHNFFFLLTWWWYTQFRLCLLNSFIIIKRHGFSYRLLIGGSYVQLEIRAAAIIACHIKMHYQHIFVRQVQLSKFFGEPVSSSTPIKQNIL